MTKQEIQLIRAFDLACKEVASYTACIWCVDIYKNCDTCKRLKEIKGKFLKRAEADEWAKIK